MCSCRNKEGAAKMNMFARRSGRPLASRRTYSRSLKNLARQLLHHSDKSAFTGSQRPICQSGATVGVRGFLENGCRSTAQDKKNLTSRNSAQSGRKVMYPAVRSIHCAYCRWSISKKFGWSFSTSGNYWREADRGRRMLGTCAQSVPERWTVVLANQRLSSAVLSFGSAA